VFIRQQGDSGNIILEIKTQSNKNMKTKKLIIVLGLLISTLIIISIASCGKDEEKTNQPPTCEITSPSNGQEITKGVTITIAVDANDSDGSITEVRFFVDDVGKGSTTSFPFNYNWNTDNENLGNHILKATCIDNSGESNSDEVNIEIIEGGGNNTPPTALFTVSSSSGTTSTNFVFDASGSTDNEDPTSNLQVRWDFDGNGSWDTGWDYDKTQNHQYGSENTYTAKLEVKDTEGLIDQYTENITVSNDGGNGCGGQTNLTYGGQTYEIVEIGNQCWMAENLNYETTNSWWYENNSANGDVYGRLYTWEAALTACPSGWSLPSDDQWKQMEMALGMSQSAADDTGWRGTNEGGKMKETGTTHWNYPNTYATNSSGFTALPGGRRYNGGSFQFHGIYGNWWSSSERTGTSAWVRFLINENGKVARNGTQKADGFSVRCLKDLSVH